MENIPPEPKTSYSTDLSPEKVQFYQQQAQELLDKHGKNFEVFVRGNETLVKLGNDLLETHEGTGYNILLSEKDMPLTTDEHLIFYNNYIGRPSHFGVLLATMEQLGIISQDNVRLGSKASKVLYEDWDIDTDNEIIRTLLFKDKNSLPYQQKVDETVETIAIFSPKSRIQTQKILDFLLEKTDATKLNAIKDSFAIPDIRTTVNLREIIEETGKDFRLVRANIFEERGAQLIIAREKTLFKHPWKSIPIEMNKKLADYLSSFTVAP